MSIGRVELVDGKKQYVRYANFVKKRNHWVYGFSLNQAESNPALMVTYIEDNADFTPAKMNYSTGVFDYGDWGNADFIKNLKPCVLGYDGTVKFELDKNDYTKKTDGTASNIASNALDGNVMVGFPKIYLKISVISEDVCEVRFSNKKLDDGYKCWSHIDNNGNEIDYCYMPAYNGCLVNSRLRSLSGKAALSNINAEDAVSYAKSNNKTSDTVWYIETFSDRMLINLLLLLVGKSTDTQAVFGNGNYNSYVSSSNTGIKNTGTMDAKGMFWGSNDSTSGVKVFGIEHWWGNVYRWTAGLILDHGSYKVKMTYGQYDGSTVDGYNFNGSGYAGEPDVIIKINNIDCIKRMHFSEKGFLPLEAIYAENPVYFADSFDCYEGINAFAQSGGCNEYVYNIGAFLTKLTSAYSSKWWSYGASISCKPIVGDVREEG